MNVSKVGSEDLLFHHTKTLVKLLRRTLPEKCPNAELFLVHKVTIKKRTHQRKILHGTTNGKVSNTVVSHDFNMTSFSPCCHNWLSCFCFCACICLLSRNFCLVCYRLCAEQLLAFH